MARPIRFGDAFAALRALLRDPDDTQQVFRIIDALSGATLERLLARMRRSAEGAELLARKPALLPVLTDRVALAKLSGDSFGRAYLRFCEREGISADGLIAASQLGGERDDWTAELGPDGAFMADRMRDSHDLWHVVTGYRGDLIGEGALLAFTFAQTWNHGIGLIVLAGLTKMPDAEARALLLDGFRRGRRAAWLPAQPWEELLPQPLARVRSVLCLDDPPLYRSWRTVVPRAA